jgi:hypothetical protein
MQCQPIQSPSRECAHRSTAVIATQVVKVRVAALRLAMSVALLMGIAAPALAADVSLPAKAAPRGVRSGEFILTPSLQLLGHHDTNLFNSEASEVAAGNSIVGATSIRFVPGLGLSNDADSNISFAFNARGDARLYLSDNEAVQSVQTVGGTADLDVIFGKRKAISFALSDNFNRAIRANNWETTQAFNRNANTVGARVEFHPGSIPERRPFNLMLAGTYSLERFDDFSAGDVDTIGTRLTSSWRFLPKTAAILDAGWNFRTLASNQLVDSGLTSSSMPFRARVGLNGAITQRISVQLMAGWGLSNHEAGESFNGLLANAGVTISPGDSTRIALQYDKDFRDSLFANYSGTHRISAALRQKFGSLMEMSASFGVAFVQYGLFTPRLGVDVEGVVAAEGSTTSGYRNDVNLDGNLLADFEVSRLIAVNIGYRLRGVQTPFRVLGKAGTPDAGKVLDAGSYIAHEMAAGVTLRY